MILQRFGDQNRGVEPQASVTLQKIDAQDVREMCPRNFAGSELVQDVRLNVHVLRKIFFVDENDFVVPRVLLE